MEIIIYCGLQGAGKSSYYKHHQVDSHLRLNFDMLRTRHREQLLLEAAIKSKTKLVIDNTNPTRQQRLRYIKPALAAHYKLICYWFCTPFEVAAARNELRSGKDKVPEVGLASVARQFEFPSFAEGYDEIYQIQSDVNFNFTRIALEQTEDQT